MTTMTVYELSREQLDELKQAYAVQLAETDGNVIGYGGLADAAEISDDVIFHHYDGIMFSSDDFFCSVSTSA